MDDRAHSLRKGIGMLTTVARQFLGVLEPIVSMIFFAAEAHEEYETAGLDPISGYFMSRSAAMGRVSADVIASTFYNFSPDLVRQTWKWDIADPATVLAARERAVRRAYERLLMGEDGLPDVTRAVALLRVAAGACAPEGRPLFAAHAGLEWPADDLVGLWHGGNLLREFRGDGHIAVLVTHGLDATEALVLHSPFMGLTNDFLFQTRMWGEEAYQSARARLAVRGFLTDEGALTDAGAKFRDMLEMETDRCATAPFEALGVEQCAELLALLAPLRERVLERRGVPRALGTVARPAAGS